MEKRHPKRSLSYQNRLKNGGSASVPLREQARVIWLANGDRNTGAFHMQASKRRKKNAIKQLHDEHGQIMMEEKDKAAVITRYFQQMFRFNRPKLEDIDVVVEKIEERVMDGEVEDLERPYDSEEIRIAVFEMHPTKAPGSDGVNARFFRRFWSTVEDYVMTSVLDVLNGRDSIEKWNQTVIGLIPKIDKPQKVEDFRPLSMCNTIYKVVSKVLVSIT